MTAAQPAVVSVVTVEHAGNVSYVVWHTPEPLAGGRSGEEAASARQVMPVHVSPRPVRALARRFARSETRRQLIERGGGLVVGLVVAAVLLLVVGDDLTRVLAGGLR